MGSCALLMCIQLLSVEAMPKNKLDARAENCVELADMAYEADVDPLIVIAIAHTESRFNKTAVSSAGARGIMQVLPRYFCPKTGKCDYTKAGFKAWRAWSKGRGYEEALCRYNSGRSCKNSARAKVYSNSVMRKYLRLIEFSRSDHCITGC